MITDPRFAPKRTDLPWLRRRRMPKAARQAAPQAAQPAAHQPGSGPLGEFLAGHSTHHQPEPAPAPAPSPVVAPPAARPAAPAPVSSSLDLDEPAAPPPAPAAPAAPPAPTAAPAAAPVSSSLDLDEPALPHTRPAPPPAREQPRRRRVDARVGNGERFITSPTAPTVTLSPVQSGIGTLTVEAAASGEVGDLRLGCAYELADGFELTMQMTQGNRFAPPHSRRPILIGSHDRFERVQVDLRQCRSLKRLIVYAFSENRRPLRWGGTLIITTHGGARIETPLDALEGGEVAVLTSIYQVRGELVVRAEMQTLFGDVREAARAYGFDRISWLDGRTPVE